jgi:hypothetical protein
VEWDCPADEVRHADALRRHIAEINPDAVSHAADFRFNPIEYYGAWPGPPIVR